jgi:hypothetical protein
MTYFGKIRIGSQKPYLDIGSDIIANLRLGDMPINLKET